MTDKAFERVIRAAQLHDPLPTDHRDHTPQCPSMARLVREHYTGFTEEVQRHLSTCGHCRSLVDRLKALDQKDAAAPVVLEFKVRDRLSNPVARAANTTSATAPLALAQEGEVQAEVVQLGPPVQEQRTVQLRIRTKNPEFNLQLVRYAFQTTAGVDAEVGFVWLRPARNDWFAASVTLDAGSLFQKVNGECRPVVAVGWQGAAERSDSDHAALLDAVRRDAGDVELSKAWIAWAESEAASAYALDVLGWLLPHHNTQVRRMAVEALGSLGAGAARSDILDPLARLLEDDDRDIRSSAVSAVSALGSAAARDDILTGLVRLLEHDDDVRYVAAYAVGRMGGAAARDDILDRLARLLEDEHESIRSSAANAVGGMGAAAARDDVLSRLSHLVNDAAAEVRAAATQALARMAP